MNGRTLLNLALGVLVVVVLAGIGIGIYNAGISQGIVEAGRVPEGAVAPAGYGWGYGWHPGFGFGFLGLLFPIFIFILLFALARAAFGGGRRWGPGGYGPNGWHEERERRIAELHRRLHDEDAGDRRSGDTGTA